LGRLPLLDPAPPSIEARGVRSGRPVLVDELGKDVLGVADDRDVRGDVSRSPPDSTSMCTNFAPGAELGKLAGDPVVRKRAAPRAND